MTAGAASLFDRETALEPLADGVWRAQVDRSWFVTTGPNGGFMAALAVRALEASAGRPARSLTLHYAAPPDEGPIEVACAVERVGGTSTFTTLRFTQEGAVVALGLGVAAGWRDDEPQFNDARMPEVPGVEAATPFAVDSERVPAYLSKYDVRRALGDFGVADQPAVLGAWIRAADGRALDAPLLAAMADALVPPAFLRTGFGVAVPTLDLTLHFRAPVPLGAEWTLGVFESRVAAGGVVEEDGRLFAEDGTLLIQSRQLAALRSRRS